MKKLLALLLLGFAVPAQAQTVTTPAVAALVCAFNTVAPAPTAGQFYYVQCDSNGKLITSSTGGGAPTGPAGGSLKGTYPNPGLADVNSIATSLAIGGATIGTNALAVTGTANVSGNVTLGTGAFVLSSPSANILQPGGPDVASGVGAVTVQFPSNTGASTTGPDTTIILAKGTTAGGGLAIKGGTAGTTTLLDYNVSNAGNWTFGVNVRGLIFSNPGGYQLASGGATLVAAGAYGWTNTTNPFVGNDTQTSRAAAGIISVDTGVAGDGKGSLRRSYTVATLPASPKTGAAALVTDQLTACVATGLALTGGGAVVCPVFYNGTAWVGD